ncbi:MAG: hypothetical protein HY606_10700, partial [Planctomycetes bacterium]|nr:hypothetical protein [Planctomycetota bacterium]
MKLFLGFKGGILSGQIAFIENPTHYEHWRQKTAFFGFYESVNDQNMSNLLFETVENEARKLSYESITGPFNPTINYTCGVLVNCFDKPNTLNMPYNYDYYDQLIINNNYQKAKDLLSFEVTRDKLKVFDIDKIPQSTEIHYRSANKAELDHEVLNMVKIFNNAWSNNWNFIPITEEETMHQAKSLKKILNTELMI